MTNQHRQNTDLPVSAGHADFQELCRRADQLFFHMLFPTHQGGCAMNTITTHHHINGVNVEQLGASIGAIQGEPGLAKFQFRATNTWINGGHNRTTIKEFYGVGKEDDNRTEPFILDADEPPEFWEKIREPILWSLSFMPWRHVSPRQWFTMQRHRALPSIRSNPGWRETWIFGDSWVCQRISVPAIKIFGFISP